MKRNEFAEFVLRQAGRPEPFKPVAICEQDGDCIRFLISDESYLRERIDSLVTVYRGCDSKKIVGCLIKGVSRLAAKFPAFVRVFDKEKIPLDWLLIAWLVTRAGDFQRNQGREYHDLIEEAKEHVVEASCLT